MERNYASALRLAALALMVAVTAAPSHGQIQRAEKRATVRGIVVDAKTGRPLARLGFLLIVQVQGAGARRSYAQVATGSKGEFTVTVPVPCAVTPTFAPGLIRGGQVYLFDMVWLRSYRPSPVRVSGNKAGLTFKVRLADTRAVTVQVHDSQGRAASGALVIAGPATVRTSASGAATVHLLKTGAPPEIVAMARDGRECGQATADPGKARLDIRLSPAMALKGRAVDEQGRPAAGLRLTAIPMMGGRPMFEGGGTANVTVDDDGSYALEVCPAPSYYVYWENSSDYKQGSTQVERTGAGLPDVRVTRRITDPALFDGSIGRSAATKIREISSFVIDADSNLLVCDEGAKAVLKVSPNDALLARWALDFAPQAIDVAADGSVLVGGGGGVVALDGEGKVVRRVVLPGKRSVTAITQTGADVFVCCDSASGYAVYRTGQDLKNPVRIIDGLSGCCGQMDIRARDGLLYVAENGRFAIVKYDRTGKKLAAYAHGDSKKPDYFGEGCCEPKNLCFSPDGAILTAASSGMEVKKYDTSGRYLGNVGKLPDADGSCVRVTLGITRDGSRLYILDTTNNLVRLVKQTGGAP